MLTSNSNFKHESIQDAESVIRYLNALKDGFNNLNLTFGIKEKYIVFEPEDKIRLEVKAKRKDNEVKLTVKFSWKEKGAKEGQSEKLIIDSKKE